MSRNESHAREVRDALEERWEGTEYEVGQPVCTGPRTHEVLVTDHGNGFNFTVTIEEQLEVRNP